MNRRHTKNGPRLGFSQHIIQIRRQNAAQKKKRQMIRLAEGPTEVTAATCVLRRLMKPTGLPAYGKLLRAELKVAIELSEEMNMQGITSEAFHQYRDTLENEKSDDMVAFAVLLMLSASAKYQAHVKERSSPRIFRAFIGMLGHDMETLVSGLGPGGRQPTSAKDLQFRSAGHFMQHCRSCVLSGIIRPPPVLLDPPSSPPSSSSSSSS